MSATVLGRYRELVGLGEIESDPAQLGAAERLDALAQALRAWRPVRPASCPCSGKPRASPRAASTSTGPSGAARPC